MRVDAFSDVKIPPSQESLQLSQNEGKSTSQQVNNINSIGEKRLNDLIEHGNKVLQRMDTHLQWSLHKQSQKLIVKVLNTETDEIVREIPPEKYLDLVQNLCEQVGLFLDERK
ncbi:hypothetical protein JCM10914A_15280 [Paenibacillus sp. JCM 10914]|uniref:flagellar protein FlaG n=1 Tax=Paenibacillus sp. JCM 10914 TaxID=1236974 RepID=UPI00055D4E3D|nr:flagellar protein FlaG [Paenibacillus sp. JCM 10914]